MRNCLVCGIENNEQINDNLLLCFISQASSLLFKNIKKRFGDLPSPLCAFCGKEFKRFLEIKGPLIGAEFLVYMTEKQVRSFRVRMGLKKAKENGKQLGRHRTVDRGLVKACRSSGMSVRRIAYEVGCSKSTVSRVLGSANAGF